MNYNIKPVPTIYKGVQFRSRLEATWAAFFDLMDWRWEYEPFDLEGWSPDFVIIGPEKNIYVEVKPITDPQELTHLDKYERHANQDSFNVLMLGLSPIYDVPTFYENEKGVGIGWVYAGHWQPAVFKDSTPFDLATTDAPVFNLLGYWKGGYNNGFVLDPEDIQCAWSAAKNEVMFLKP